MTWRDCQVGDFVIKGGADVQTGPFGTQLKASDYVDDGTPVINVRNVGYGDLRTDKLEYVAEHTTDRLRVHLLRENDIVFGRKGAVDRHLFVSKAQENWMQGSDCIRLRFTGSEIDPRFISYAFLRESHQQWMLAQSGNKATMASLNQEIIGRIPLRLPLQPVQERVVRVLSAYDESIENNRRRMGLLEKAARLLYEEWFVRFRFPGHERTPITNGLPQGWEKMRLDSLAKVNRASLAGNHEGAIEYVDISSVTPGKIGETSLLEFPDAPSRARRIVRHGDIIWSCVRPNRRSHAVIWEPPSNLIASTGFAVITPKAAPTSFLYYATTTDEFVGHLEGRAKGAAYPAVVAGDFEEAVLVQPTRPLLAAFDENVKPMFSQIHNLRLQNDKLRAARDLLLPRLMSGEVDV